MLYDGYLFDQLVSERACLPASVNANSRKYIQLGDTMIIGVLYTVDDVMQWTPVATTVDNGMTNF